MLNLVFFMIGVLRYFILISHEYYVMLRDFLGVGDDSDGVGG